MLSAEISMKVSVLEGDEQIVCAALCWSGLQER